MEDELGEVGRISVSPVSDNLTGETHSGNTEGGIQVEGSYEGGDAGEIMVEVVGSEVLVDGVSRHKERDIGSGEVRDLEGHVWENEGQTDVTQNLLEDMDVSTKWDVDKMVESDLNVLESRDEKGSDIAEQGDLSFSRTVEGGACCALPLGEVGASGDNPGLDAVDVPVSDAEFSTVQSIEVWETDAVAVSDEKTNKDEPVCGTPDFVRPESSHVPAEAIVDGDVGKEEASPSSDNAMSHVHLGADSGIPHLEMAHGSQAVPSDVSLDRSHPEDVPVDGINSVVGEVGLVTADAKQGLLANGSPEDSSHGGNVENASVDGTCGLEVKFTDERKVSTADGKESLSNLGALVSDVQNENQGCLHQFHGMNPESNQGIGEDSQANSESIDKKSVVVERVETVAVECDDLQHSNDRDECLKADGDLKTDTVLQNQNHAFSKERTQSPGGGDTTEINKDNGLNNVTEAETKENKRNKESLNCCLSDEIVHGDSGKCKNQPVIDLPVIEVTDDEKTEVTQVKVADGDGSSEGGQKLDSEISMQSIECQGNIEILPHDLLAENVDLSAKGAPPKFETADATATGDHASINSQSGSDNVVEDSVSCQSKEQQVSVQVSLMPNYGIEKMEGISITPQEICSIAAVSDDTHMSMLPEIAEKAKLPFSDMNENSVRNLASSNDKLNMPIEAHDDSSITNGLCFMEGQNSEAKLMDLEEERDSVYQGEMADIGTGGPISENENLKLPDDEIESLKSLPVNQSGYLLPPEDSNDFSVSDLVWGKVRSHPWWPGQIFDPGDASEKSLKYYKKDAYLVVYFGDQTFAWNNLSELKPFRTQFSQIEKQSSSEVFQNAVDCALLEVSRRVELGLACSCIPKDVYSEIESQIVENAGIREESSRRYGVDLSSKATCFEPDKLLDYIGDLACHASSGVNQLDLVIAQAQLYAFCRLKGYRSPSGFPSVGELLENDGGAEQISDEMVTSVKCKHAPTNDSESRKERSLTELMGEKEYSPDAEDELLSTGRKRKAVNSLADELDKWLNTDAAKSALMNQIPKPSFKIGDCIRRVASQLTATDGSPRIYEQSERRSLVFSAESLSSNELLSQLQLLAQDQKKGEIYHNNIQNFFLGFRSSIALNRRDRKKKADSAVGGSGEEFEFDDVNDSYWSDRIVHNNPEEQLLNNSEDRMGNFQPVSFVEEKFVKPGRKSRKRFSSLSYSMGDNDIDEIAERKKQETSPAELILNFTERNCLPSEINLNKMFRRFGPLMESETEVDHDSGRAKVIFKHGSDAEVARNSSEKFNIFGPVLVNYQIGYSPLISVKISPLMIPQCQNDAMTQLI